MKTIVVTYSCNNGYTCSCCGRWWDEIEEYEVADDVDIKKYVDNLISLDNNERSVSSAYLVAEKIC